MNQEKTIQTVQQRVHNICKALERDGAKPIDIHRALLFSSIAVIRDVYKDSLTDADLLSFCNDILEQLNEVVEPA